MFIKVALSDIKRSFKDIEVAQTLASSNFGRQYKFLALGRFWRVLNTLIFVSILGIFYSTILDREASFYLPYLAAGYVIWNFLSSFIIEGMNMFMKESKIFSSYNIPLNTFALSLSLKLLLQLCIDLIPVMLIFLIFNRTPSMTWLYFPLGIFLIYMLGYGAALTLAILNSLVKDMSQIIPSILRVGFFVTPVIWSVEMAAKRSELVTFNPLYYFIEVARGPLMGQVPELKFYIITGTLSSLSMIIGFLVFAYGRRSVYYVL